MFRLDNGKEITWAHQQQIFQGLEQTYANKLTKDSGPIIWQIALCYHTGFGTARSQQAAHKYAELAKSEGHPVAKVFADLINPHKLATPVRLEDTYATRISALLHSNPALSEGMPSLVKACFEGNSSAVLNFLSDGAWLSSSTIDGCSLFHWLFVFRDNAVLEDVVEKYGRGVCRHLVDIPFWTLREIHSQWPLQLLGSPLAVAISVNCLAAVSALLSLGADPFSRVYDAEQFPPQDPRSQWTAFHIAANYHCSEILRSLVTHTISRKRSSLSPLACVLSFSTSLERLAMHGPDHIKQLDETIRIIRDIQPLATVAANGMTALMQAIDFQDYDVVAALLRAEPELATAPLRSPKNRNVFNLPIHFAAQIAARRDVPENLMIPQLINSYTKGLSASSVPPRDNMEKTPLHLAVTGPSNYVTKWILEEHIGLLQVEDAWGRTPLHYCASVANCDLLLDKGANVDHTDKHGMTSLHRACYLGASELVRCLLKRNPKLNLRNNVYGTPLHCGVISGSVDVVMALVEASAPLNATDKMGNTAVHVAAKLDRHRILRILMHRGADITIRNLNDRDAQRIASDIKGLGGVGTLSILQRGWETRANRKIFDFDPDAEMNFGLSNAREPKKELPPDFLWVEGDEGTVTVAEADEPMDYEDDSNNDVDRDGKNSFDEKEEKKRKFDQIVNTIRVQHFPGLPDRHWAIDALKELISVFFDETIWHPGPASQISEIMARAAYDCAKIIERVSQYEKGRSEFTSRWGETWPSAPFYTPPAYDILEDTKGNYPTGIADEPGKISGPQDEKEALQRECEEEPADRDVRTGAEDADDGSKKVQAEKHFKEEFCFQEEARLRQTINMAVDCLATIVIAARPRGTFPGRRKPDLMAMIHWELRTISAHGVETKDYSSTLLRNFPQLSRQSWEGSTSGRYSKRKGAGGLTARHSTSGGPAWNSDDASRVVRPPQPHRSAWPWERVRK